jgi:hypothetical protein
MALSTRALILLARGQDARAQEDAQAAVELSRDVSDAQLVGPVLSSHAMVMAAIGRLEQAHEDWTAMVAFGAALSNSLSQGDMARFAWLAVDLDKRQEALAIVDQCDVPDWADLGRAILTGEPAAALDSLDRMGLRTDLAYTQLRLGGEHAREALRFYESVGATRFARAALAALETSA